MRMTHSGLTLVTREMVTRAASAFGRPPESKTAQAGEDRCLEIRFGRRRGQIDIRVGHGIEQRANELRPADGGAALGANVRSKPVEEDYLPVEEDDGDFRPGLVVHRWTAGTAPLQGTGAGPRRRKDVLVGLAGLSLTGTRHGSPQYPPRSIAIKDVLKSHSVTVLSRPVFDTITGS
jgi:hypothetical protein